MSCTIYALPSDVIHVSGPLYRAYDILHTLTVEMSSNVNRKPQTTYHRFRPTTAFLRRLGPMYHNIHHSSLMMSRRLPEL